MPYEPTGSPIDIITGAYALGNAMFGIGSGARPSDPRAIEAQRQRAAQRSEEAGSLARDRALAPFVLAHVGRGEYVNVPRGQRGGSPGGSTRPPPTAPPPPQPPPIRPPPTPNVPAVVQPPPRPPPGPFPPGQGGGTFDPASWPRELGKLRARLALLSERGWIGALVLFEIFSWVKQYNEAVSEEERKAAEKELRRIEQEAAKEKREREREIREEKRERDREEREAKREREREERDARRAEKERRDALYESLRIEVPPDLKRHRRAPAPSPRPPPKQSTIDKWLNSPLFRLGTAVLGARRARGAAAPSVALNLAPEAGLVEPIQFPEPYVQPMGLTALDEAGVASQSDEVCSCRPRYARRRRRNPREKRICYTRTVNGKRNAKHGGRRRRNKS